MLSTIDPIALAFVFFSSLRLVSYLPQIVAVARDRSGAAAISFTCWSIWIGANTSTALYAWVKVGDIPLAVISTFSAACCIAVLALAACKRLAAQCASGADAGGRATIQAPAS